MVYTDIEMATFIKRPNRFVAHILIAGHTAICHVKNTGRCAELLIPGATIYVQKSLNPKRKTPYSLIAVKKGERIINMDSQIPNAVFREWALKTHFFENLLLLKAEQTYGDSRFDFYVETKTQKAFVEVKGVTLEEAGVVRFPDAPTLRGLKHLETLVKAKQAGYEAYVVFIIQMDQVRYFEPNGVTHPAFKTALQVAFHAGVHILALSCHVTPDSITAFKSVPVHL